MHVNIDELRDLEAVFGTLPGSDRTLIDWDEICAWLDAFVPTTPNMTMRIVGESTDGHEIRMLVASSPETLLNIDKVLEQRANLTHHQSYRDGVFVAATTEASAENPIVMITAGIHANEVGGVQMMPQFLLELATGPRYQSILEEMIVVVVPTLNPDGMTVVHDWYRQTLNTPIEGSNPPTLYHRYAGHDNNRDWYQRHLQETRVVLDEIFRVWIPNIVVDLHQMGQRSPRYVVPPYIDPAEPNVHPLLYQLASQLGTRIATDHLRAGNEGVCSGVLFDCYSPTRAWQHYHGGVRILAEAASAAIASPVAITADRFELWEGAEPVHAGIHMARTWTGEHWHLADILHYHRQTIDSVLNAVAENPNRWVEDQRMILADQTCKPDTAAFVIPPLRQQINPAATVELLDILAEGDLEIRVVDHMPGVADGSFLISVLQPFGSYAEALLSVTSYPEESPAYDVTSHCLPIHMGVDVRRLELASTAETRDIFESDLSAFRAAQADEVFPGACLAIDPRSHASIKLVLHALKTGSTVYRSRKPQLASNRIIDTGSWIITDSSVWDMFSHAARMHVRTTVIPTAGNNLTPVKRVHVGLYDPQHQSATDFGWLRLWLERSGFTYETVTGENIQQGALNRFDVLLVPHLKGEELFKPYRRLDYPDQYKQGLGGKTMIMLNSWVRQGGHVIAFEDAVRAICEVLSLELHQPHMEAGLTRLKSCGAIVSILPVEGLDATLGLDEPFPAMYFSPYGYAIHDTNTQLGICRFSASDTLISGSMIGAEQLPNLYAAVQLTCGDGHVTAFAFRPHFRTQMLASEPILSTVIMQNFDHQEIPT